MDAKARRRRYLKLRDALRANPTDDFARFRYACRAPMAAQAELLARSIRDQRPLFAGASFVARGKP